MKEKASRLGFSALALLLLAAMPVRADPLVETRYCGAPARNADGTIRRSPAVRAAFQRIHPCPTTGLRTGACPGWSKDHVLPLSACGCDSVSNSQWLKNEIKSGPGSLPKDRWERRVYSCPKPESTTSSFSPRFLACEQLKCLIAKAFPESTA